MAIENGGIGLDEPEEKDDEAAASPPEPARGPMQEEMAVASRQEDLQVPRSQESELLSVRLPIFEGPLDLLLHLVREHRLDIFDIPIAFITSKYVEMIERMRELNLDVAGEFLVMAATLAHIKSRMLLPKPELDELGEDGVYEGDPRADLVRRLLEYQKYKEAATSLGGQDILGRDVFVREVRADALPLPEGDIGLRQVGVLRLIEALDAVLARAKVDVTHEIIRERLSLSERITEMIGLVAERGRVVFADLFEGDFDKEAVILTFLALLEMSRLGLARFAQENPGGEILIMSTERTRDGKPAEVLDDFH